MFEVGDMVRCKCEDAFCSVRFGGVIERKTEHSVMINGLWWSGSRLELAKKRPITSLPLPG
jgi:hypothetical protein